MLKKAAELGNEGAQEQLADLYRMNDEDDEFLPKNEEEAIKLYKILAEKGNLTALYNMAIYYSDDTSKEWNPDLGNQYFEMVGDSDESLAEYVAQCFENLGDYDRAIKYYKRAKIYEDDFYSPDFEVDEENIMSYYYPNLAYLYYQKGDIESAIKYTNKGIIAGYSYCKYFRGVIYLDFEDIDNAEKWFLEADSADAYYQLGMLCFDEKYVKRNEEKALHYFTRAEEKGCKCSSFINSLKSETSKNKKDEYFKYLANIVNDNIELYNYPKIAEQDLKKDFGMYWDKLSGFSKSVLKLLELLL